MIKLEDFCRTGKYKGLTWKRIISFNPSYVFYNTDLVFSGEVLDWAANEYNRRNKTEYPAFRIVEAFNYRRALKLNKPIQFAYLKKHKLLFKFCFYANSGYDNLHLVGAFTWDRTKEGWKFWNTHCNNLEKIYEECGR
jgi:hypothetical protein